MFDPRERDFTLFELASFWNVPRQTIKRLFQNQPGILMVPTMRSGKRATFDLRVPESVARRVYRQHFGRAPVFCKTAPGAADKLGHNGDQPHKVPPETAGIGYLRSFLPNIVAAVFPLLRNGLKNTLRPKSGFIVGFTTLALDKILHWLFGGPDPTTHFFLSAGTLVFLSWASAFTILELGDALLARAVGWAHSLAFLVLTVVHLYQVLSRRIKGVQGVGESRCICGSRKKFINCHGKPMR